MPIAGFVVASKLRPFIGAFGFDTMSLLALFGGTGLGLASLFGMRHHGVKKILAPAMVGMGLSGSGLLLFGFNFASTRSRLQAAHERAHATGLEPLAPLTGDEDVDDRRTLRELERAGADLSKPTDVVHYLYVPGEADAKSAQRSLEAAGYRVEIHSPPFGYSTWSVAAHIQQVPSLDNLRRARPLLQELARGLGGSYDGWEAAVVRLPAR